MLDSLIYHTTLTTVDVGVPNRWKKAFSGIHTLLIHHGKKNGNQMLECFKRLFLGQIMSEPNCPRVVRL